MKPRTSHRLSLTLAALLPCMPLLRSALPVMQSATPSTWAIIFRWAAGGIAMFGYHAISSASSVAISPPSATIGVPYAGTITYSGSHAGAVSSMAVNGTCLGSYTLAPGLTVRYFSTNINTASVTGTPTGGLGTVPINVSVYDGSTCGSGLSDTRSTSLIILNSGGSATPPVITVAPQSVVAQVGADVLLSGGASGNPTPGYYWKQGITAIPNATNNTLLIPAVQLTNSGVFTLYATNSQGLANSACYVCIALTPGSNILAYRYTNYVVAKTPLVMYSLLTNVPSAVNTYSWSYNNNGTVLGTSNNLVLTSASTVPANSGPYTISFTSTVGGNQVASQHYDSYWAFGFPPTITSQPGNQNVGSGSNATFSTTLTGTTPTLLWYQNQSNLVATQSLPFNPTTATATTNMSLVLSNVSTANAGNYTVVITNFWGATTSSVATLTVPAPLSVTTPASQTNYAGKTVGLSVTASGTAPFSYQWQKGGVGLANGGAISGADTSTLTLAPAAPANSGNYQVVVTNSAGAVTSGVAVVSIVPVPSLGISAGAGSLSLSGGGGVSGSTYVVEASTNLANPTGWKPLQTNAVPANGALSFTTNTTGSGQQFYRLRFP